MGRVIFERCGWLVAATLTPAILGITGFMFFSLIEVPSLWSPVAALLGSTPLMLVNPVPSLIRICIPTMTPLSCRGGRGATFDSCHLH